MITKANAAKSLFQWCTVGSALSNAFDKLIKKEVANINYFIAFGSITGRHYHSACANTCWFL